MKNRVKIFVEGVADEKFFKDYLVFLGLSGCAIRVTNGKDGLFDEAIINELKSNSDNGGVNLVFIDADDDFSKSKSVVLKNKGKYNVDFEMFLMPDNKSTGALEDLLENIINNNNQPIFDCWHNYEDHLLKTKIQGRTKPLTIPAKKTKIYAYLEALLGKSKKEKEFIKERARNYQNQEHWNLSSDYLNPLKNFLLKFCI
jgi:hypothetical protein